MSIEVTDKDNYSNKYIVKEKQNIKYSHDFHGGKIYAVMLRV